MYTTISDTESRAVNEQSEQGADRSEQRRDSHVAVNSGNALGQRRDANPTEKNYGLLPFSLRGYQVGAVEFARNKRGVMLFMGMRTGKTRATCAIIDDRNARVVVMLMPLSVVDVWRKHVEEFLPRHAFVDLTRGATSKRIAMLTGAWAYQVRTVFVAVNFEAFWRRGLFEALRALPIDVIGFDEVHKLKAPKGVASEKALMLASSAEFRIGLTGTVFPHSPLDGFAQYRLLDSSVFGISYVRFRALYANIVQTQLKQPRRGKRGQLITHYSEVVGFRNEEMMAQRMNACTWRVGRDVLELTPATHQTIRCALAPKTMRLYENMRGGIRQQVEGGTMSAANALVAALRLQQLTGGYTVSDKDDDDNRTHTAIDHAKQDALADLFEAAPEPWVCFYMFVDDKHEIIDASRRAFGEDVPVAELNGQYNNLDEWQRGECGHVIAVQVRAGGVGVDLSRAALCALYSTGFSLGDYDQALARIHGGEQTRPVGYYHLIAPGTIDEGVSRALRNKTQVNDSVLDHIKRRRNS